jgi:hypothetical protein
MPAAVNLRELTTADLDEHTPSGRVEHNCANAHQLTLYRPFPVKPSGDYLPNPILFINFRSGLIGQKPT